MRRGGGGQGLAGVLVIRLGDGRDLVRGRLQGVPQEGLALRGDRDPCASGEEEPGRDRSGGLDDVVADAVTGGERHPSLGAVPVDLEPLGVAGVQVVGGDEGGVLTVGGGRDAGDGVGDESGLRVESETLGVFDGEGPLEVGDGHD